MKKLLMILASVILVSHVCAMQKAAKKASGPATQDAASAVNDYVLNVEQAIQAAPDTNSKIQAALETATTEASVCLVKTAIETSPGQNVPGYMRFHSHQKYNGFVSNQSPSPADQADANHYDNMFGLAMGVQSGPVQKPFLYNTESNGVVKTMTANIIVVDPNTVICFARTHNSANQKEAVGASINPNSTVVDEAAAG